MAVAGNQSEIDRDAIRGMALMIGAAIIMPGLDAIAKVLGETLSPAQIGFMRFVMQTAILCTAHALLRRTIITDPVRKALPKLILAGGFMSIATISLFWALQFLPLANTIVLLFVAPLFLTVFGAIILGEKVGPHRTGAVIVGLIGAMIVVRPNFMLFGWASVLPLLTAAAFAALMTTLRSISFGLDGFRTQTVSGAFAGLFLGIAILVGTGTGVTILTPSVPSADIVWLIVLMGIVGTIGQGMMTFGAKFAEASLIAPFQYLEIVSATVLGYILFREFPDALTWTGTAIILAAGLYTIHRERRLMRTRARNIALG